MGVGKKHTGARQSVLKLRKHICASVDLRKHQCVSTCPFQDQDDYIPIKKVKYEYLTPRQLPCGNRPTDVVWTSEHDNQYTADELLRLAKDQRLQREADRRRPASPSTPDSEPPISEDDF